LATVVSAVAQTGTVSGYVTTDERRPLAGADLVLVGADRDTRSDDAGYYTFAIAPSGRRTLRIRAVGYEERLVSFVLEAGQALRLDVRLSPSVVALDPMIVTATREADALSETPMAVAAINRDEIRRTRAAHPSELMNQVPGVWVNVTGGEGHMTAIRQPLSTDPVYLYLEDGVPTRSTGFFNHNALYEVNLPQAARIEVMKGPGTALYGSDAIGGTINVSTRAPSSAPAADVTLERGAYGYLRALGTASGTFGANGLRADLNVTRTGGWRAGTGYDRQSATVRWDRGFAGGSLKTVIAGSRIEQHTAGSSTISESDYRDNPTANYTPISFRDVLAVRLSAAWERLAGGTLIALTPYGRYNSMDILPNWSLTYDPGIWDTWNLSAGLLARVRHDFAPWRTRVIVGADLETSPGVHREHLVIPTREGPVFTGYTDGDPLYDYDVTFRQASPYAHVETSPLPALRITGGARLDAFGYSYDNHLSDAFTGGHRRPADTSLAYTHLSPKAGVTWTFGPGLAAFGSWRHGFRAPSEGQVFRQGGAANTVALAPVKVNSWEAGIRGTLAARFRYDVAAYTMTKTDDILTLVNPDGSRETVNAGRTSHRGVEVGLDVALPANLSAGFAGSYARHRYDDWHPTPTADYTGNEIESAPRVIGSARLRYAGAWLDGGDFGVEVVRVGVYWMDAENTTRYQGHTLVNLRGSVGVHGHLMVFARLMNLADVRYADRAAFTTSRGSEFAPGMPRTLYAGVEYR
jgi:outer membrane receptor protein involved in Fe transport